MQLLDLFAGIGGFSLAAHWMGWQTAAFVEKDPFCQKVLRKNFGSAIDIHDDIIKFSGEPFRGRIDLITGGFPCQPFSAAGKQKGKEDQRYLFPEMLRVIGEVRPRYVVAENVRGLLSIENGDVFTEICSQLEGQGYDVWTFNLPASSVEAPHERQRLWIVCSLDPERQRSPGRTCGDADASNANATNERGLRSGAGAEYTGTSFRDSDAPNADSCGHDGRGQQGSDRERSVHTGRGNDTTLGEPAIRSSQPSDSDSGGPSGSRELGRSVYQAACGDRQGHRTFDADQFKVHWLEVATALCRMDDGIPAELDFPRDNRTNRLKALGNSIVPMIAFEIFRAIKEVD